MHYWSFLFDDYWCFLIDAWWLFSPDANIGLDNVVIVDSDDSLLIAAKGKIQDVKLVEEEMKKRENYI